MSVIGSLVELSADELSGIVTAASVVELATAGLPATAESAPELTTESVASDAMFLLLVDGVETFVVLEGGLAVRNSY